MANPQELRQRFPLPTWALFQGNRLCKVCKVRPFQQPNGLRNLREALIRLLRHAGTWRSVRFTLLLDPVKGSQPKTLFQDATIFSLGFFRTMREFPIFQLSHDLPQPNQRPSHGHIFQA